jgi:hypothetical protein
MLCEDITARSSKKSEQPMSFVDDLPYRNSTGYMFARRTSTQNLNLSKAEDVISLNIKAARSDSSIDLGCIAHSRIPFKQIGGNCDYHNYPNLPVCHSVNGISLEDLQAFETQLMEVKDVKMPASFFRSSIVPISKATVLGSRSANSASENQTTTNSRLSLSCGSKVRRCESSAALNVSVECGKRCLDSSQPICNADALRLTKVTLNHMLTSL